MGYAFCFSCTKILPTNYHYQKISIGDAPEVLIKCPRCGAPAPEIDELMIGVCSWLYEHAIYTMFSCSGHIDDAYGPNNLNQMYVMMYGEPLTEIIKNHPLPKGFSYEVCTEDRPYDDLLPGGKVVKPGTKTVSIIRKTINCYTSMPWVRIQKRNTCIQSLMRWLEANEESILTGSNEREEFLDSLPFISDETSVFQTEKNQYRWR